MSKKQLKLGAFLQVAGHHFASWRFPTAQPERVLDIEYFTELAKTAERGKFDTIFFADWLAEDLKEETPSGLKIDPLILHGALAAVTKNIGLVATVTTTYNEPFQVARKFMGIDHLSKGRAAWNVITSAADKEAALFGKDQHLPHAERYERAEEFVDVVKKLWQSIDQEALVINKESGKFFDLTKVQPVNHEGKWFKVQGTLDSPTSPQGYPVIVQAGSSEVGKELAARTAEVVFTAAQTLEEAQAFYRDVKGRLPKYGRDAEDLKIMPGVFITVAKTEEEAIAKRKELNTYILPEAGLKYLSLISGIDLTGYSVEDPLPNLIENEDKTDPNTRTNIIFKLAERENLKTIREVYEFISGGRGHLDIVGTPKQIADQLQEWLENGGADGFNVLSPVFPDGLNDIVDLVIPELQRRGIFRTEYEGRTLRENLGLKNPTKALVEQ